MATCGVSIPKLMLASWLPQYHISESRLTPRLLSPCPWPKLLPAHGLSSPELLFVLITLLFQLCYVGVLCPCSLCLPLSLFLSPFMSQSSLLAMFSLLPSLPALESSRCLSLISIIKTFPHLLPSLGVLISLVYTPGMCLSSIKLCLCHTTGDWELFFQVYFCFTNLLPNIVKKWQVYPSVPSLTGHNDLCSKVVP